jgi:hypothetical protein
MEAEVVEVQAVSNTKAYIGPAIAVSIFSVVMLVVAIAVLNLSLDQYEVTREVQEKVQTVQQSAYTEGYYDAMMSIMANTSTAKRFQRDASQYGYHLSKIVEHIDSMLVVNGTVDSSFYSSGILKQSSMRTKEPLSWQRMPKEDDWKRYRYRVQSGYWPIEIPGLRTEGRMIINAP